MKTITKNALTNNAEKKQKKKQSNKKKKKKKKDFFLFSLYSIRMRCGGISPRTGRVNLPARIPALATPEDVVELFFVLFLPTTFYFFFLFLLRFFFFVLGVDSRRDICFKKIIKKYNEEIIQRIFGMTILLGMEFPRPLKSQTLRTHTTWSALILFCFALT